MLARHLRSWEVNLTQNMENNMSMNRVFLMGRLTRDIELRTVSQKKVANFTLAVNEKRKNQKGEVVDNTHFFDITAWERIAENCAEYLGKGSPVLVEGKLQLEKWVTEDGQKRSRVRVRADRVQFLASPKKKAAAAS